MVFSHNVQGRVKDEISVLWRTRGSHQYEKYLGLPPIIGRSKRWAFSKIKLRYDSIYGLENGSFFLKGERDSPKGSCSCTTDVCNELFQITYYPMYRVGEFNGKLLVRAKT